MNYPTGTQVSAKSVPAMPGGEGISFGAVLRRALGNAGWRKLNPAIADRFSGYLKPRQPLRFVGTMHWVYCSPIGALLARVIRRWSILPDRCARDAEFTFDIGEKHGSIVKQRTYRMGGERTFRFVSRFSDVPRLHEEFGGGIGMNLRLIARRDCLWFCDQGYFLRFGRHRLPLPRWLTVGRFDLMHRNIDANRFQIIIRVAHPLFGTLFYQRGVFEQAGTSSTTR